MLEHVGHMSQGRRNQKGGIGLQPDVEALAFELKGDRLGMTLDEFKAKYAREDREHHAAVHHRELPGTGQRFAVERAVAPGGGAGERRSICRRRATRRRSRG